MVAISLRSLFEFKKIIKKEEFVALYTGEESGNFYDFYRFGEDHISYPVYYTFNPRLIGEIFD